MYVNFVFVSVFLGFSVGTAPLIGFNYGADNQKELKNLFRKSMIGIAVLSLVMTASAILLARPLAGVFVGYDAALLEMTARVYRMALAIGEPQLIGEEEVAWMKDFADRRYGQDK